MEVYRRKAPAHRTKDETCMLTQNEEEGRRQDQRRVILGHSSERIEEREKVEREMATATRPKWNQNEMRCRQGCLLVAVTTVPAAEAAAAVFW